MMYKMCHYCSSLAFMSKLELLGHIYTNHCHVLNLFFVQFLCLIFSHYI